MKKTINTIAIFILIIFLIGIVSSTETAPTNPDKTDKRWTIKDKQEDIGSWVGLDKKNNADIQAKNVELTKDGSNTKVIFKKNGFLKRKYNDKVSSEYSNFDNIDGKESEIKLDNKGNIIEAKIKIGKEGDYVFGNYNLKLKSGDEFRLKDGKAVIKTSDGNLDKSRIPKYEDLKAQAIEFTFEGDNFKLYDIPLDSTTFKKIKFDDKGYYIDESVAPNIRFTGIDIKNVKTKTYLDFEGKVNNDYDAAYVSMSKNAGKIVIGNNGNNEGPTVLFNKDNTYGLLIENTDHFAIKTLGGYKDKTGGQGSYIQIENRNSQHLVPKAEIVGWVAINQDNKGIGTYLKDDKFYMRVDGKVITDISESGTTTVPIEIQAFKIENKNKVPIYNQQGYFVMSNNLEIGYGPDPTFIRGTSYSQRFPYLTRGVSNWMEYNYIPYTKQGVEQFSRMLGTPIKLTLDSYANSFMTPDRYRMLIDYIYGLTPTGRKAIRNFELVGNAGGGAIAWGGPGSVTFGVSQGAFSPGIFNHELAHAVNLASNSFWSDWSRVGGQGGTEGPSEFVETVMFKEISQKLRTNAALRGQIAVLTKYGIMSQNEFDFHMSKAGLQTGSAAVQSYINGVKG